METPKEYGLYKTVFKQADELYFEVNKASGYSDSVNYYVDLHKGPLKGGFSVVDIAELEQTFIDFFRLEELAKKLLYVLDISTVLFTEDEQKAINELKFHLRMVDDY